MTNLPTQYIQILLHTISLNMPGNMTVLTRDTHFRLVLGANCAFDSPVQLEKAPLAGIATRSGELNGTISIL
jgi:hypothetical protein